LGYFRLDFIEFSSLILLISEDMYVK